MASPLTLPTTQAIEIQNSGWYGITLDATEDPEKRCRNCRLSMRIQSTTDCNKDKLIHLPIISHDGQPILSMDYGKLIYLANDSKASILLEDGCDGCEGYQWNLVRQRWSDEPHLESGHVATNTNKKVKSWVCAWCRKGFSTVSAVESHVSALHRPRSCPDSVWQRPLRILHDDPVFWVVVKPQGMAVMGEDNETLTLQKSDLLRMEGGFRKGIPAHRLDAATGGVLLVAKTKEAERQLKKCFAERTCQKRYRALLFGKLGHVDETMTINEPVSGKPASTICRVLRHCRCCEPRARGWVTVVDLFPHTGRNHQLRRHMKFLGHSIWGDKRYGFYTKQAEPTRSDNRGASVADVIDRTTIEQNPHVRMCLWAMEITFPHPTSGSTINIATMATTTTAEWVELHEKKEFSRLLYTNPVCFLSTSRTFEDGNNGSKDDDDVGGASRNVMVLSWLTATNNEGRFMFSLNRHRHTASILREGCEFVLSVPTKGMEELVLSVGRCSGRWGSKFEQDRDASSKVTQEDSTLSKRKRKLMERSRGVSGLAPVPLGGQQVGSAPALFAIDGTVAHLKCRIYSIMKEAVIDENHFLVLAEVVEAHVKETHWDSNKKLFRPVTNESPYLTFFGSQTFGYASLS